jgi:hypothetical protein
VLGEDHFIAGPFSDRPTSCGPAIIRATASRRIVVNISGKLASEQLQVVFEAKVPRRGEIESGQWYSAFQPNSKNDPPWHEEEVWVDASNEGGFTCQTINAREDEKFDWAARGTVYNGKFVSGTWASKRKRRDMGGTFILYRHNSGDMLLGFFLGEGDRGSTPVNYGGWVLANDKTQREDAKRELAEVVPGFLEFVGYRSHFVDSRLLKKLSELDSKQSNLKFLVPYCEELNRSFAVDNPVAVCLLLRSVMNNIPPVFGKKTFAEVAAHCRKQKKSSLEKLEENLRNFADHAAHVGVGWSPNMAEVATYKGNFDALLEEIIDRAGKLD